MSALAKSIRDSKDSDTYDLKNLNHEQAVSFVNAAFKEPLELDQMIKVTLAVGAGKLARQKYDDDLGKWVCGALKDIGYEDDRGASLSMECAGSFKFQHDTGKNMKWVHVFPKIKPQDVDDEVVEGEEGHGPLSAEWLCVASELETFKNMVDAKMPAWIEKRRCSKMLQEQVSKLESIELKLSTMVALTPDEQRMFDVVDRELLASKTTYLAGLMKSMVDEGKLTSEEKALVLSQINTKLETVDAKLAQDKKNQAKLQATKEQITQRKQKVSDVKPIKHALSNAKELRRVWRALAPMDKLLEKAGPKGRWSTKLTSAEVSKLGEKEDLDNELAGLLSASRHWFETPEEFESRVDELRKTVVVHKKKPTKSPANPPRAPVSDGWATVASKGKKQSRGGGSGSSSRGGGAFAALA
eukprot:CAMPEP_0203754006 /NCGR_PEP_ID=MMETSP0098-20131031/7677_1 /ASSEMBLY_ACC=CAM_ASM_000208 /TAXON_ID=96639 /ORGANISM=" , Strain NY0313808BC1" /LENGTH=412 /DNA_ID=CAMNT_0050644847 /DNA_START=26 /DNA_END=1260 /DNA_ORIENTATION=+